jgi:hypothetical protein
MKISKFMDRQIMDILKQAQSGIPAPDLCQEHGISSATFYNVARKAWRHGCVDDASFKRACR